MQFRQFWVPNVIFAILDFKRKYLNKSFWNSNMNRSKPTICWCLLRSYLNASVATDPQQTIETQNFHTVVPLTLKRFWQQSKFRTPRWSLLSRRSVPMNQIFSSFQNIVNSLWMKFMNGSCITYYFKQE